MFDKLSSFTHLHFLELFDYGCDFLFGRLAILLGMDRFEHCGDIFDLGFGHHSEHVTIKMHDATLPFSLRVKVSQRLDKAQALVTYKQLDAG